MKQKILLILFFILFLVFACLPVDRVLASATININTAILSQLDELTGIGPKYAQAIIDARPFFSVDDLSKVKGIGEKTLQKIKDQGWACVECSTVIPSSTGNPATDNNTLDSRFLGNDNSGTQITYPSGVYINEILPNPSGADENNEWIELYNFNSFEVDLSNWQIQDTEGTITTFTIPQNSKILANSFLVFKRPDTKIMLNNDSDGLNLLTPDKKIIDSANYTKAPLGQSYNKTSSGWAWSTTLTPETKNIIIKTLPASATPKALQAGLSKTKNSVNNNGVEAGLADLSQGIDINQENVQNNNPWFLFFIALAITIILATIVLIIKLKFYKNHVRT